MTLTRHTSGKARKQRARYFQAPRHVRHRQMTAPVVDPQYVNVPRAAIRKGDTVEILRGQGDPEKDRNVLGVKAPVVRVDYKRRVIFLQDIKIRKRGNKVADRPIDPSNVRIVKLDLTDRRRKAKLDETNAKRAGAA